MTSGPTDRRQLERWVRGETTPQRVVRRARIVLLALDGLSPHQISDRLGISRPTVTLWIDRFERDGPGALLHDAPGRGRHASVEPSTLIDRLREAGLLDNRGHPVNLRRAAAFLNVNVSTLWRALRKLPAKKSARR